jgi:hypothetical protein
MQGVRDKYRKTIAEDPNIKLFGEDFKGTLADGTEVDFGKDKYSFDKGGSGEQNIDLETKEGSDAAAFGDSIAAAQGLKGKARESVAALFAGAALKNAKGKPEVAAANMNHFMNQLGLDRGKAQALLNQNVAKGKISKADYAAFSATLNRLAKGDKGGARQLSEEEIDQIAAEEAKAEDIKKLSEEGPKALLRPAFKDKKGNILPEGEGVTKTAPDGINTITTYPDGTEISTLIGVGKIKPSEKIINNIKSGKMPSTNLTKDDLKQFWSRRG